MDISAKTMIAIGTGAPHLDFVPRNVHLGHQRVRCSVSLPAGARLQSPKKAKEERLLKRVQVIDSHTGGEPTRIVIDGGPDFGNGDLQQRRLLFQRDHEAFRRALVTEPRGSEVMVGALLCEPSHRGLHRRRNFLQQQRMPGHVRARHDRPGGDARLSGPNQARDTIALKPR